MWKKFLSKYGIIFFMSYAASFIFLVTIGKNIDLPTFPGDIFLEDPFRIYLPFTGSLAFALLITIFFEIYKTFKNI